VVIVGITEGALMGGGVRIGALVAGLVALSVAGFFEVKNTLRSPVNFIVSSLFLSVIDSNQAVLIFALNKYNISNA
jgi:hypothetical protein